ncbi:SPJ_0845 family protein [Streptococcus dentasini]
MAIQYKKTDELEKMLGDFASFPDFEGGDDPKSKQKQDKQADKK